MTIGEIWDRLTDEQRKKAFFFFWQVLEFYGDANTWVAVALLAEPPAGFIMSDMRLCPKLDRRAPGGRARLAVSWVLSMFEKVAKGKTGESDVEG